MSGALALRDGQQRDDLMIARSAAGIIAQRLHEAGRAGAAMLLTLLLACGEKRAQRADTGIVVDTTPAIATVSDSDSVAAASDTTDSLARVDTAPSGRLMPPWGTQADSTDTRRSWFVLRHRSGITELIPTKLALVNAAGACDANDARGQAAKPLAINTEWIVMIADVPGLRAGAIDTATILAAPGPADVHTDSVAISFRGERLVLRRERTGENGFRVLHEGKNGRTTLYSTDTHDEGRWLPRWMGDLNRDGALDIILEATNKYSVQSWWLYMSGGIQPNSAWRPAAMYTQAGC